MLNILNHSFFYQVEEMEDLIVNRIRNCNKDVDEMLHNEEGDGDDHEPVVEYYEENCDEDSGGNRGNNNDRKIQCRTILTPLDMNILTNRS